MKILYTYIFISLLFGGVIVHAQNSTSSPYSLYNIGDINPIGSGRSNGLGGAGIALPSENSLNNVNPASYYTIDSLSFMTDFGLNWKTAHFTSGTQSEYANNVGLNSFAIGFRNTRWWKNSLGIAPFSSVGNSLTTQKNVDGSSEYFNALEQGSGGLTQFYWGNAFRIGSKLSLGVNAAFIFGNIKQTEEITTSIVSGTLTTEDNIFLRKLYLNYGFQYTFKLSNQINGTVGGVFGLPCKLNLYHEIISTDNTNTILQDKTTSESTFTLPKFYGVGLSLKFSDKLLVTSDYRFYNWSQSQSLQSNVKLVDCQNYILGGEYTPSTSFRDHGLKKVTYRAGGYLNTSYLMVNGQQLRDRGFSLGMGIPVMQKKLYFNFAFQMGIKDTQENRGIITENYQSFILNISLLDFWFFKPKFD
ncbi:MAG TPA: hypothetical protein VIH57_10095 [Bacteroidales bacterium]